MDDEPTALALGNWARRDQINLVFEVRFQARFRERGCLFHRLGIALLGGPLHADGEAFVRVGSRAAVGRGSTFRAMLPSPVGVT